MQDFFQTMISLSKQILNAGEKVEGKTLENASS